METYYKELGLEPGASFEQVKQAWRTLMAKYHPDRYPGPASEEMSKRVNDAYQKLKKHFEGGSYQPPVSNQPNPTPESFEIDESLLVPKKSRRWSIFKIAGLVLFCIVLINLAAQHDKQTNLKKQQDIANIQQTNEEQLAKQAARAKEQEEQERQRVIAEQDAYWEKRHAEELSRQAAERARNIEKAGPENIYDWEWHVAGQTIQNKDYYVSWNQTKSLHNDPNKKQFWYRFNNETLYKEIVDCRFRTMRLENITIYDSNNSRIGTGIAYGNAAFTPIDTSLVSGSIASRVCRQF